MNEKSNEITAIPDLIKVLALNGCIVTLDAMGTQNENDSRIRSGYALQDMAVIRHMALNLLSQASSAKVGKKAKRLKVGWDNTYLTRVLASAG